MPVVDRTEGFPIPGDPLVGLTKEIARVESTMLGYEDHGIFTATLVMDYGGSHQGVGNMFLEKVAYEFLTGILAACGVDCWEKVRGRTVFVLSGKDRYDIKGIAPLPTERGTPFLFDTMYGKDIRLPIQDCEWDSEIPGERHAPHAWNLADVDLPDDGWAWCRGMEAK